MTQIFDSNIANALYSSNLPILVDVFDLNDNGERFHVVIYDAREEDPLEHPIVDAYFSEGRYPEFWSVPVEDDKLQLKRAAMYLLIELSEK